MNPTGIMLILSGLSGMALAAFGGYTIIDDFIRPSGLMFEGIVLFSLGIIMLLMVTIASAIGKTMITFADIMKKQSELQNQLRQPQSNGQFGLMLSKIMSNPNNFTIDASGDVPESLKNIMKEWQPGPAYSDMSIDTLEEKLAEAMKIEDYEEAKKISNALRKKKGWDNSESNDKKDE